MSAGTLPSTATKVDVGRAQDVRHLTLAVEGIISSSIAHLSKRPRTSLNTRFDRMIDQVNATFEESSTPIRYGRTRTSSAGSSSVSSGIDMPKTPVDEYDALDEGRLGKSPALVRGNRRHVGYYRNGEESEDDLGSHRLEPQNPLRQLISPPVFHSSDDEGSSMYASPSPANLDALPLADAPEEPIFAFSPTQENVQIHANIPTDENAGANKLHPSLTRFDSFSPSATSAIPRFLTTSYQEALERETFLNHIAQDQLPNEFGSAVAPFSTPGPSSNLSVAFSHLDHKSNVRSVSIYPDTDGMALEARPLSRPEPIGHYDQSSSHSPAHEPPLLSNPQMDSEPFAYNADLPPASDDSFYDNFHQTLQPAAIELTGNSRSSPLLYNPFTTPGPQFPVAPKSTIYFDSPTEDPSNSDPLDPFQGYQIEELDYKWEPFLRHDKREAGGASSSECYVADRPCTGVCDDVSKPLGSNNNLASLDDALDSPPVTPTPDIDVQEPVTTPEPTAKALPVFAPAPGIFISPLRVISTSPGAAELELQTPMPVTPANRSTLPRISSIGKAQDRMDRSPSRFSPVKNRENTLTRTSTPIRPRKDTMRTRSVRLGDGWQLAERKPRSMVQDTSAKLDILSQVSTESIESWTKDDSNYSKDTKKEAKAPHFKGQSRVQKKCHWCTKAQEPGKPSFQACSRCKEGGCRAASELNKKMETAPPGFAQEVAAFKKWHGSHTDLLRQAAICALELASHPENADTKLIFLMVQLKPNHANLPSDQKYRATGGFVVSRDEAKAMLSPYGGDAGLEANWTNHEYMKKKGGLGVAAVILKAGEVLDMVNVPLPSHAGAKAATAAKNMNWGEDWVTGFNISLELGYVASTSKTA
ncbi:hypothetical protein HWV62_38869 [Athelia sp. TMB]|nr:hypothetical protein HWV62_38869 [Athelia sp. TMB]